MADDRLRLGFAALLAASVTLTLCVLSPLRQTSGDTVGGRLGGLVLRCAGDVDVSRIDWIRRRTDSDRYLYWLQRDATGAVTSIFGPAPAVVGAVAVIDFDEGEAISDHSLRVRERVVAALLVAISAALLTIAIGCRRRARDAMAGALVAATSFAGAATLGQGLWQATVALPFLVGGLTVITAREHHPRLSLFAPALLGLAVMLRPTIAPLGVALGITWAVETRGWKKWLAAAAGAALAVMPLALWNLSHLGSPLSLGQWNGNTRLTESVFMFDRGHIGYALGGLLVSPGRGLLWFAPIVLFGVVFALRRGDRAMRILAIGVLAQIALITLFFKWYGGLAFGPRLLSETVWLATWLVLARDSAWSRASRIVAALAVVVTVLVGQLGLWRFRAEQWETRRMLLEIDENALWDFVDSPITATFRDSSDQLLALDSEPADAYRCRDGNIVTVRHR